MKRLTLSLLLFTGLGITNGYAQTTPLTLQQCLQYALANNQQLAQVKLNEDMGDLKVQETRAQALPQIDGTGQYTNNFKKQIIPIPGDFLGQPGKTVLLAASLTHNAMAQATLTQQVFNQTVFTGLKAARTGREYYKLQTAQTEENVIYNVSQLYYQVLVTRERIVVLQANIHKLDTLVQSTDSQVKNGLAKRIDLDRIKVNLVNYKTQLTTQQNALETAYNLLKQTMGMPIDASITLPEASFQEIAQHTDSPIDFGAMHLDNRVEYLLLKKEEALQQLQKKAYQAEYYPSLQLFANYSRNGLSNKFDLFESNSTASWYSAGAAGLTLKIPIFDGFARRSRVGQATVTLKQLSKEIEATNISLNTQYNNARLQVQNNLSTIRSQKENVDLAQEVYYATQNNYKLGLAGLTDLLESETSLTEAQNNYNEALLQYKLAELDIIKANGNLKTLLN
ncbi:Outer membrane protein TolC [Chitinophaga costaii]|uniref:Outer membrane protein TolC n=1 Tax=Chitinophaga costaii TaxID=1335309 RepID=A0A1C4AP19_9BACT|nr:TolC family protein [Chitinophaga costaii]PUZ26685.1 TolC family protein [Chitinophaga costaii]SCB96301.1 Outer membrane protein TolC [Chitinophaga costaii]